MKNPLLSGLQRQNLHSLLKILTGLDLLLKAILDLVNVSIDDCHCGDVDHIANRGPEVCEVDRLVEAHLYGADDLHVGVECLQHLIAGACAGKVGEDERVDIFSFQPCKGVLGVA